MTFEAKTLVPLPCDPDAAHAIFEDAANGSITVLEAPTGYALTEGLALAFSNLDRRPLWLRLGPEDSDPATFLLSLVTAARRLHRDAGQSTLKLMKEQPGPVFGWSALYAQLAQDLRICLGSRGALVLEEIHHASAGSPTLSLVGRYLLPGLAGAGPCVLVSHGRPQAATFGQFRQRSASELSLSAPAVRRTLEKWAPELTARTLDRAMWLIGGRAALLAGLRELASTADPGLGPLFERVANTDELAAATAEVLLADCDRVILYLQMGDHDCAARAVASRTSVLMDLGQWATVERWLDRLPEKAFSAYPDLNCSRADIAAIRGDMVSARRWFDCAASQYAKRGDAAGESRSMLAASTAAAEAGDLSNALSRAHAVSARASTDDLRAIRMWAMWQIGRISLVAGDSDAALSAFHNAATAAAAAGDVATVRPVRVTGELAVHVEELRRTQESHREAQAALGRAEHEAFNRLTAAVRTSELRSAELFGADGWSGTPAPLKLPGLVQHEAPLPGSRGRSLDWLRRAFLPRREQEPSGGLPLPGQPERGAAEECAGRVDWVPAPSLARGMDRAAEPVAAVNGSTRLPPSTAAVSAVGQVPELAVHLLGPLHVAVDDKAVEDWTSARCRSLFGYLLRHREPWPAREVLMEVFWPESAPEASRNSLNVAIHGLRRTLRTVTGTPVVVHAGGAYRISHDLRLWLDVDEFDSRIQFGRRLEDAGDIDKAARDYEYVEGLYRGDFMADDPYEDWAALTRERLRLAYLEALGRLSHLYFNAGHYTACASLCQRIIEKDPCREDAHRRLMRCYSRQSQPHLALIQYRACVRALADQLGVAADPATARLHDQIRQHQYV